MKKLLLTFTLFLGPALFAVTMALAGNPAGKMQTLINEYRHHEGFDGISVGPLGVALLKTIALSDSDLDEEDRAVLRAFNKIKRVTILDFEDAEADVKARFVQKAKQILSGMELILEAKDDGDKLSIYGVDKGDEIRDCILWDPDGTIICVRGSVTLDKLVAAVNND